MTKEKAAIFVDNSNIYKGLQSFGNDLYKLSKLNKGQYLRIKWEKLIHVLEQQNGGIDIFARHFFASLPPAADVSHMTRRPSEEEWLQLVKKSAQSGFYKSIQEQPCNFTLHSIPLKFVQENCRRRMKQAFYRCRDAQKDKIKCSLKLDLKDCYKCRYKFIDKFEKGVDVALSTHLILFTTSASSNINRVILMAGDGDYKESLRYIREILGKDVQIVTWRKALSRDLIKYANKGIYNLDDKWSEICRIINRPPVDEAPATALHGED